MAYSLSSTIAEAPPPPLQIPATPMLALFCFKTFANVIVILAPDAPSGCPKATAPPFTFTFVGIKLQLYVIGQCNG
jgi:hypothetical protein